MGVATQTSRIRGSVSITPTITNLSVPTANTEVPHTFAAGTKQFYVRIRSGIKAQIAFTAAESGTKFITIPPGSNYCESALNLTSVTIYIQTSGTSQIAEILEWT